MTVKIVHSGGNGVSIAPPDTNPASDKTVKLPAANGTLLTTESSPSFRNLIINGAMQVAVRGASITTGTGNFGVYTLDRWKASAYATDQLNLTVTQETSSSAVGFNTYLKASPNAAETALAADEYAHLRYSIEAQDCQQLKWGTSSAESVTLSFWVKSNATGVGSINFLKHDTTQQQITRTYTISVADTWEKKTVTIPGNTGSGINNDNGIGINIFWFLAAGSDYTSSDSSSWQNFADAGYAYGQALNLVDSTSDYLAITGVQLEIGDTATSFEYKSYGDELARCQRYCWRFGGVTTAYLFDGIKNSTTAARVLARFPVAMRAVPTITYNNLSCDSEVNSSYKSVSAVASTALNKDYGGKIQFTHAASSGDTGDPVLIYPTDTAGYVQGEAEL